MPLRVATLNVWNRCGPYEARMHAIRTQLRALDPDVLALQEVLSARAGVEGPRQADEIARDAGYHVAFGSARDEPIQFGNALLSRWPIVATETFELPSGGTTERRCLLLAEIDAPFARLFAFVTHLNWKLHEGRVREEQARFVAERIRARVPMHEFPPILCGDLNAEPEANELRFLRGLASLGSVSTYFADCFALVGEGPSPTFSPRTNDHAWHTHEPERRIDYVLVRGPDSAGRGMPLSARRCFDTRTDGVLPSDHYGVVAELSVDESEIPEVS